MQDALVERLSSPVPRYTSYPTAPHFNEGIGSDVYADWLGRLGRKNSLSLYAHIPYCDRLCWFCACHTKQTLRYEPVEAYLKGLHAEIAAVGGRVSQDATVTALHFGGGSPTLTARNEIAPWSLATYSSLASSGSFSTTENSARSSLVSINGDSS